MKGLAPLCMVFLLSVVGMSCLPRANKAQDDEMIIGLMTEMGLSYIPGTQLLYQGDPSEWRTPGCCEWVFFSPLGAPLHDTTFTGLPGLPPEADPTEDIKESICSKVADLEIRKVFAAGFARWHTPGWVWYADILITDKGWYYEIFRHPYRAVD